VEHKERTLSQWGIPLGILMILAGGLGILYASLATLASVLLFGGMLVAAGGMHIVRLLRRDDERRNAWVEHVLMAAMYFAMGAYILLEPQVATLGLTVALCGFFLAIAALRFTMAWRRRAHRMEAFSQLMGGVASLILVGVIVLHWPVSALWAIGVLVSVELLMNGWMMVFASLHAMELQQASQADKKEEGGKS